MLELRWVDVDGNGLAIQIGGERLVGVARETVGVFRLLRRVGS
jgi:hypothetical protein